MFERWNRMVRSGTAEGGGAPPANPPAGDGGAQPPSFLLPLGDTRPDHVPEKFWDAEGKGLKADALLKSYTELEGTIGKRADAYRAEMLKEIRAGVPEKPEDYPADLSGLLPEGFEAKLNQDDPLLAEARQIAHETGMKPEAWTKLLGAFVKWQAAGLPNVSAETEKLGEGGAARVAAVDMWLAKALPEGQYKALENFVTSAGAVEALESLMSMARGNGQVSGVSQPGGGGAPSAEEANAAMRDPRYWDKSPEGEALREKAASWARMAAAV